LVLGLIGALISVATPDEANAASRAKRKRAMAYFDRGAKLYKAGKYNHSAPLFLRAWSVDPKPEYLFNAARAEHRAGMLKAARQHYDQCLNLKGAPKAIRERSRKHIAEVDAALAKAAAADAARKEAERKAAAKAAAEANVVGRASAGSWRTPAGWAALGSGLLAGGVGAWLLIDHGSAQAALDDKIDDLNGQGLIVGTDYQTYHDEQTQLHSDRRLGIGTLAAGATLAAVGAWLLRTAPDHKVVILAPGPGLALLGRF